MQPSLDPAFLESPMWQKLTPGARCALEGLLQFAMRRHTDWVVEGTPKQLGQWLSDDCEFSCEQIVLGLRELGVNGCLRRGRVGFSHATSFILQVPLAEPAEA
jgi:hypothetical protein